MDIENVRLVRLGTLNHVPVQKGFLQAKFLNTSESSNDNCNVVNAPQEPIVFNLEPREYSSQSPPQIDHQCCYGCSDSLDGVFCRRCTCESCRNGAHIGYNCPPKVLVVSNPEPCHSQNVDELPQTLTNFHPTCYSGDEDSFAHDSKFSNDSLNVFHPPPQTLTNSYEFCGSDAHYSYDCPPQDRVYEIKNAVGNKQYKPKDVQELYRKILNDVQNIHEELDEYINIPSWNCPEFSSHDDDENYTIAITPKEPDNSLSMRDEHLDTISTTESDEVIKSRVEDLVPILKEVKDDDLRKKLMNINLLIAKIKSLNENPTSDHVLKSLSPFLIPIEDIDSLLEKSDTSLSYSDNSLPEFETFSNHTEEMNSGSTTTHADYSLSKYDSFLFEIEPDQGMLTSVVILAEPRVHVLNVLTTHSTLMLDSDFIPSDNSLPESEIFYFDIEEKNSGSTTIHADISLPDLECFNFKREPEPDELKSIVDSEIRENVLSATNVNLLPEDDHSPLFAYVVWIFFSFSRIPWFLQIFSPSRMKIPFLTPASPIIIFLLLCQVYLIGVQLS
uniref:Uncharacterized protein n=1 Tax=Tanacetum cinerariifolium TaxID=118510 RepID=A0A6L2KR59_TANCI|nr:hypothetical protein [Tanacetum cinerariifolium]